VRAGFVEKGVYNSPLGVPQGGVVSPILSNVYLHPFDLFMEKFINEQSSNKKLISKVNPKMAYYSNKLTALNKQYMVTKDIYILKQIKALRNERNKIPSRIRTGIRIRYIRYADDWIIGIIGNKEVASSLKDNIKTFLLEELKIQLTEKTHISHFKYDLIPFLGVNLRIPKPSESKVVLRKRSEGKVYARVNHTRIYFYLPETQILTKLAEKGFLKNYAPGGEIVTNAITKWIFLDHRSIILKYNSVIDGYLNYYSFVDNQEALNLIYFILVHSCAKTLARKYRLDSRAAAFKKFGGKLYSPGVNPTGIKSQDSFVTKKFHLC
jgi:hypothetical protein